MSTDNIIVSKMFDAICEEEHGSTVDEAVACAKVAEDVAIAFCQWYKDNEDANMYVRSVTHLYNHFITEIYGK